MDYTKEIRDCFHKTFANPLFDESDIDEMILEIFEQCDTSYEKLSAEIAIGISNGYTLEYQLELVEAILNPQ